MQIDLDGQMYEIRAKVMTLGGYSGHADQAGLVRFALGCVGPGARVLLVHGDDGAKRALARVLEAACVKAGCRVEVTIAAGMSC